MGGASLETGLPERPERISKGGRGTLRPADALVRRKSGRGQGRGGAIPPLPHCFIAPRWLNVRGPAPTSGGGSSLPALTGRCCSYRSLSGRSARSPLLLPFLDG